MQIMMMKVIRKVMLWVFVMLVLCPVKVKAQDKVEAASVWIW